MIGCLYGRQIWMVVVYGICFSECLSSFASFCRRYFLLKQASCGFRAGLEALLSPVNKIKCMRLHIQNISCGNRSKVYLLKNTVNRMYKVPCDRIGKCYLLHWFIFRKQPQICCHNTEQLSFTVAEPPHEFEDRRNTVPLQGK